LRGRSDDDSDGNQTELYHFAHGAFVDINWYPGDLDENDEVSRGSEASRFPESYGPKGDDVSMGERRVSR
jgi:hypothetical protein